MNEVPIVDSMRPKETKNRIIDNPFDMDVLDMILENAPDHRRYLGAEKRNWVRKLPDAAQEYMNKQMDCFQGRWEFEFFHSDVNVLHHTDTIPGNDGDLGFILPIAWDGHAPATIMYEWWSDRRVMYAGQNKLKYVDTGEVIHLHLGYQHFDMVFEWSTDKALIFDCKQLHSARKFKEGAWKEFIIGFVV